jgi:selenocysteine lyase/cysteine desulfurase
MPHVTIYGPPACSSRGGTVAFNVDGVHCSQVERRARDAGVSLRGGCFCNPGCAERALGFTANAQSKETLGAVRISVGLANTVADVERGLDVIASFAPRQAIPSQAMAAR